MTELQPLSLGAANTLAWTVPVVCTAAGLLAPAPRLYFEALVLSFVTIAPTVLLSCLAFHHAARLVGTKVQKKPRSLPPLVYSEAWETTRAMYIVACFTAWPLMQHWMGRQTALFWSFSEATNGTNSIALYMAKTVAGLLAADVWLYIKHRALHHRLFWVIHKTHHTYHDPSTFAGFAVHPVEAVLTFGPILFFCMPMLRLWAPAHILTLGFFVVLNLYLHCGYDIPAVERAFLSVGINTSVWHNLHHEKTITHFGEMLILWDVLLQTSNPELMAKSVRAKAAKAQ